MASVNCVFWRHHVDQHGGLLHRQGLALLAGAMQVFAMFGIGDGIGLVAVRLAGLGQQDQRCGIGGLGAEGQVQQDEGICIPDKRPEDVEQNPDGDEDRLADQESRGAEEAGEGFGLQPERIIAEGRGEMRMRAMKAKQVMLRLLRMVGRIFRRRRHGIPPER